MIKLTLNSTQSWDEIILLKILCFIPQSFDKSKTFII
jgi:hypothetical protein